MDKPTQIAIGKNISQNLTYIVNHQEMDRAQVEELIKSYGPVRREEIISIIKEIIDKIPAEKRINPDKRIFVPAIQQLSYCLDDECLKNTFKSLLSSSMNLDKQSKVHPSFTTIIAQLSSDEVKLLNSLIFSPNIPYPVLNIRQGIKNCDDLGIMVVKYFSDVSYGVCEFPDNIGVYLENLERLELIDIPEKQVLRDESHYKKLINHPYIQDILNRTKGLEDTIKYDYERKVFLLTRFGLQFLSCCMFG